MSPIRQRYCSGVEGDGSGTSTPQRNATKFRGEKMKELEELQVRALGDNGFLFGSTC